MAAHYSSLCFQNYAEVTRQNTLELEALNYLLDELLLIEFRFHLVLIQSLHWTHQNILLPLKFLILIHHSETGSCFSRMDQ